MRRRFETGQTTQEEYERFIERVIAETIARQEQLGIDVLVHGEFERNDMVQYFGEQLSGFAFTHHGWVQSYGSRYVRPPIIYGDVARPAPMTVRWSTYAQSLTDKPVKGMLTGPVTMLNWSFVRDDQPRETTREYITWSDSQVAAFLAVTEDRAWTALDCLAALGCGQPEKASCKASSDPLGTQ